MLDLTCWRACALHYVRAFHGSCHGLRLVSRGPFSDLLNTCFGLPNIRALLFPFQHNRTKKALRAHRALGALRHMKAHRAVKCCVQSASRVMCARICHQCVGPCITGACLQGRHHVSKTQPYSDIGRQKQALKLHSWTFVNIKRNALA